MNHHMIPVIAEHGMGDFLFFLVVAVFGIIRFVMDRYGKKPESKHDSAPKPEADPDQARRTREIQEEIRRRIAQSKGGAAQPSVPAPANHPAPQTVFHPEPVRKPVPVPQRREPQEVSVARNVDMMAQLAAARREEEESRQRAAAMVSGMHEGVADDGLSEPIPVSGDVLRDRLHSAESVREAFLLSEILARPVAERGSGSCLGM